MKVSTARLSKYLAKEDLPEPIVATMDRVTLEMLNGSQGQEEKYILHFTDRDLKPIVLNILNRKRIIAAYGDESDDWTGKPLEIYVDPNVEMGGEIVGGIRVRIPAQPARSTKGIPQPATTPSAKPATQKPAPQRPQTIDDKHQIVLNGYRNAQTEAKVEEFRVWADKQDFAPHHQEEQSDAYHAALDRVAPIPAMVEVDKDIPF